MKIARLCIVSGTSGRAEKLHLIQRWRCLPRTTVRRQEPPQCVRRSRGVCGKGALKSRILNPRTQGEQREGEGKEGDWEEGAVGQDSQAEAAELRRGEEDP